MIPDDVQAMILEAIPANMLRRFAELLVAGKRAAISGDCEQIVGIRFNQRGTPTHFKVSADERTK
jgi:hypothetical protein